MSESAASSGAATTGAAAPSAPSGTASPPTSGTRPTTASEGAAVAQTPAANGGNPPTESAPIAPWRTKTKIDGREVDLTDKEVPAWLREAVGEDEAISTYRLRASAQGRMKEAAELRKKSEAIINRVKSPEQMMAALLELHDGNAESVDRAVEAYYKRRLDEAQMSLEQRENALLRQQLEQQKQREEAYQAERRERERAALQARYVERFKAELPEAMTAAKLPMTKAVMRRIQDHAREAFAAGTRELDMRELVTTVKAELRDEWEQIHGSADADAMLELMGEERVKALRARDIERFKAAQAANGAPAPAPRRDDGRFAPRVPQTPSGLVPSRDWWAKRRGE